MLAFELPTTGTSALAVLLEQARSKTTAGLGRIWKRAGSGVFSCRMALHGADALVVNISQTPGVVILEYEVQGNAVGSGKLYENRFISGVTIEDRKIVGWRDYMDSLAAMSSLPSGLPFRSGPSWASLDNRSGNKVL